MKEQLVEEDIQWLAKILARMPGLAIPAATLARLQALDLIREIPDGWEATDKGVIAVISGGAVG